MMQQVAQVKKKIIKTLKSKMSLACHDGSLLFPRIRPATLPGLSGKSSGIHLNISLAFILRKLTLPDLRVWAGHIF